MKDKKMFEIREYGRSELALMYSPDIEKISAWRKLKTWIDRSPGLWEKLEKNGYTTSQRIFTPVQVEIIVGAIGEP